MKTFLVIASCALVGLTAAPPVLAGQAPGNPARPRTPSVNPQVRYGSSTAENTNRLIGRLAEPGDAMSDEERERQALLERIAPMVAEGRCNEARQAARQAGDRAVSRRVGQVCVEGRPTPLDEAS